jgi:hypothetical protein
MREVIENARDGLRLWKKRFGVSGLALFLSCASVCPFLFGHSLNAHWDSFGKYLVMLSMGLLLPFVVCGATTTRGDVD